MIASLWSIWNTVAQPALARLKPGECALLIILAASLLVLSIFRERYLAVWTAAWTLLVSSRLVAIHGAGMRIPARYVPAVEQAAFVVAIGLFAGAVFVYIRERNLLAPLAAVTARYCGLCRRPRSSLARCIASAGCSRSLLSNHSPDRCDRIGTSPPRPSRNRAMDARRVSPGAASELAPFH